MLQILINSGAGYVDYTKYVVAGTLQGDDLLNQPGAIDFVLANIDGTFVQPVRSSYVRIYSTINQISLATGFITVEPEKTYYGDSDGIQRVGYHVMVTTDEWLLNVKQVPFIPAFVNQTMGEILQRLAETLMPGFYTYDLDDGDIVPYFAYDPTKMWSAIAKQFADAIRYRYKVIDRVIHFKPYDDLPLGISYDDSNGRPRGEWFDPYNLNTELLATPVINDATVIGEVTAKNILEDNFIGDGITSDFNLKQKVFRGASALLLQENWDGQSFSTNLWNVVDPDNKFALVGALNLGPGTLPAVLGTEYILGNNGLELGGHLDLLHAELEFVSPFGSGIIGGVYSSPSLTLANCKVGFMITGGNIKPIVNGILQPTLSAIAVSGQHYILQTSIDAGSWSRYNRKYRTMAGVTYGGVDISATSDVTFLIQEVSTTQTVPIVLHQSDVIPVTLPSFGLYAPVNTIDLHAAMTTTQLTQPPQGKLLVRSLIGPTGLQLPTLPADLGAEQKYILGFGLQNQAATLQTTADVQELRFYSDMIPGAGARIKLRTWEAGKAVGRVQDAASIAVEGVIPGDDGIRSAIVTTMNPLPRTAAECELAGQAFIADRTLTQYNGSYKFPTQYLIDLGAPAASGVDYPRPGRFFNVLSIPKGITNRDFIVRKVHFEVLELRGEQINFDVEFGPDLYTDRLLPKFLAPKDRILTPEDAATEPTPQELANVGLSYLGDLTDATITNITGTTVSIDLGQVPVTGAEVRRLDAGWGLNDRNRLLLTTAQTFTLDRAAFDQTYYIRQINGAKTSRYTTELRVVYPQIPEVPTGTLDTRDWLKPTLNLGFTGDIRNIFGIEVRSCMVNVSGTTVSGALAANLEIPQECLDLGLIADDPSVGATVPIINQNFTTARKKFSRSEFLFDYTLYAPGTQFYFEAVVTNAAYRDVPPREIYIEKQMRERTANPNPVFVHTLSVPPGCHRTRIRFTAPFTGYLYETFPPSVEGPTVTGAQDYTDAYRVWLQAESPPDLSYNPNTTIFPSSSFELHSLRLIGVSAGAQKAAIEIPLSAAEGESNTDVGQSSFSTTSTSYVDVTPSTLWIYNSAEWGTISSVRFNATLSCPQTTSGGLVTAALYDVTAAAIVATVDFPIATWPSQAATLQTSFNASGKLIDGHQYSVLMKVTGPATTGHFYKARLVMVLNPLLKSNVYWRFSSGPGSQPIRVSDAGAFPLSPGSLQSRLLYNPTAYSDLTGLFVETTSTAGAITVSGGDNFNRANGPVGSNWLLAPLSDAAIVSNAFSVTHPGTGMYAIYVPASNSTFSGYVEATWTGYTGLEWGGPSCLNSVGIDSTSYLLEASDLGESEPRGQLRILRMKNGSVDGVLVTSGPLTLGGFVKGTPLRLTWDVQPTRVILNGYVNGIFEISAVDSALNRCTSGKPGLGFSQFDGNANAWDDWSYNSSVPSPATFAMVDAELNDGAITQLPGWFGYTSGDHVPAQNYTVNTNMAAFVATLVALARPIVDDYVLAFCGIIFSAWQFQLFAAVLNNAQSAAGVVTVNALRNSIIAGYVTAIANLTTNQQDWVNATELTFSSTREVKRAVLTSSQQLTDGNRYYSNPGVGIQQGLLVFQVTAVNGDELETTDIIPVPEYPSVLMQRRFTAPSDLNWIFDNNPYRIREICFRVYFFNTMWEYSPVLELSANLVAPPIPVIEVISVLSIDIQIRLDVIGVEDTTSVTVEMSPTSLFIGTLVRVKGGPLQSVYSLHVPTGPNTPVAGQYIRARRTDYLGSSDWSAIVFVSATDIRNSSFLSATGAGTIVSSPLNNLFSYVSDGTTITWSWPTFTLTYGDGFVQYVTAGTFTAFTGLVNSTTYKFYPYLTGVRQAVSVVTILKSTVSSGASEDPSSTSITNADGNTPLSRTSMVASTTGGGASSGSGGGVG